MSGIPVSSRTLRRTLHLALTGILGAAIYASTEVIAPLRPLFQWCVFPLAALSGLWLWQGHRISARLRLRHSAGNA